MLSEEDRVAKILVCKAANPNKMGGGGGGGLRFDLGETLFQIKTLAAQKLFYVN